MQEGSAGHCHTCSPFQCHLIHPCHPCHLPRACSTTVHPCEQWLVVVLGGALSPGVSLVVGPPYMVVSCPSPFSPWPLSCSCDVPPAAIRCRTSIIVVGCQVLMVGHHCRVVMFSCHLILIVVVVHSGELVPDGCWCSLLSSLAASTHDPPCKQWLTGLGVLGHLLSLWRAGVGVGLFLVIVGPWCMVLSEEAGYPMLLLGMGCVLSGAIVAAHL